jgi:predicted CDP-diglyceride synthetase/phosphatidate cytidylyltransferase
MSVFGDLLFSLFKRKNDIKDYGNIIAGHGGILDRFDSHLSVCFFYSIITIFCSIVSYCLGADAFFNVGFTSPLTPISNT